MGDKYLWKVSIVVSDESDTTEIEREKIIEAYSSRQAVDIAVQTMVEVHEVVHFIHVGKKRPPAQEGE